MKAKIKTIKGNLLNASEFDKITLYNELSRAYMYRDIEAVIYNANEALSLANQYDQKNEQAKAYFNIGAAKLLSQDMKAGVDAYHKAMLLSDPTDYVLIARIYMGISLTYTQLHCFEKALFYGEKALNIALQENLYEVQCSVYNNHGHIYNYLEDYELSDSFFVQGLKIAIHHQFTWKETFLTYNLARNKLLSGNTDVEKYIFNIESLIEEQDEMWYLGPVQILWAMYYIMTDSYENAVPKIDLGLQILEEEKQDFYHLLAHTDLTHALTYKNYEIEAEALYQKFLHYLEEENLVISLPKLYLKMSIFYSKKGQVSLYQKYLRKYVDLKTDLEQYINKFF
ncbi:MAG: tetratricopeptide repeat protein [Clostridiales bacterium]|nr:tetratricopeptide repeat protein [Clostridiales bacterium]